MSSEKNAPRYFMHKYRGKKPAFGISPLIDKYTNPGDMIIDPIKLPNKSISLFINKFSSLIKNTSHLFP